MKRFKHHIDLIRYATRRVIHRVDHGDSILEERLAFFGESLEDQAKKTDWLQWAREKLGE